ncbi:unnamed protein product [Blepharisma stoltei]|uniref:Uncharacterized protein n=1 Tax=Blepharisma stoltei TaxID=1481888 RepID=A0AAU9IRZ9_9CILI|nr:unnamed protein product [Blepharisma stoltei]
MSDLSGSEVNIKELGEMYAEITIQIEIIPPKVPEVKEIIPDVPSPTYNERRKAYHYQKIIKEYENAALEGANSKRNNHR